MKKRAGKRRKKSILIAAGTVLVIILTAAGYQKINREIPPAVVEAAQIGEWLEYRDGVMISLDSFRFLTGDEQEKLYQETGFETIYETKLLEVTLTLENTAAESRQVAMSDLYAEGIGISNGINKNIADASEGRYSSNMQELQPGEKKQVCYPYEILKNQVSGKEWAEITEREFWLTFSSYPVKKKLLLP
ncbi:hypothetical protein EBB54_18830 [Schaedlerella arabinosiphila]|uniref:DUF4352 domain-containing protein n=1 Tax=Schaedlerella arabinosiphila TaxID=2044587 RepID=A0A3R8JQT7_9FIRM|nr:hypothetical protein [Schaedlerella arabinosiphila]RRK33165.1 hypothetical protein EBB54_18830 [Schaedlerella arabinosiphila]